MKRLAGALAVVALTATACGGRATPLFSPQATTAGYTVLYSRIGPNHTPGPCARLVPTSAIHVSTGRFGQSECPTPDMLDVQERNVGDGRMAVWGVIPAGITRVTVAGRSPTAKGGTYLAVFAPPHGAWTVAGYDASGHMVLSVNASQASPQTPKV